MTLCRTLVIALLLAAPLACWSESVVLTYKGTNKWVAPEDNAPLRKLLKAAKGGKTHYTVGLPKKDRALAVERLEVLKDLLAKSAGKGVVMVEGDEVRAGTIGVGF